MRNYRGSNHGIKGSNPVLIRKKSQNMLVIVQTPCLDYTYWNNDSIGNTIIIDTISDK